MILIILRLFISTYYFQLIISFLWGKVYGNIGFIFFAIITTVKMVTIGNYERRNANGDILYPSHSGDIYNSERRNERMKNKTSIIAYIISIVLGIGSTIAYCIGLAHEEPW